MQKVIDKPLYNKSVPPIKSEVVDVTPGMAQAWLDKNISNRNPKPGVVAAYMRAMIDGRWILTGDAKRNAHFRIPTMVWIAGLDRKKIK